MLNVQQKGRSYSLLDNNAIVIQLNADIGNLDWIVLTSNF